MEHQEHSKPPQAPIIIPADKVIGAAIENEAPKFWQDITITGTQMDEKGNTIFIGRIRVGEESKDWKSIPASTVELKRYQKAIEKASGPSQ